MSLPCPSRRRLEGRLIHSTADSVTGTTAGGVASSMTDTGETFACDSPPLSDLTLTWNNPSPPMAKSLEYVRLDAAWGTENGKELVSLKASISKVSATAIGLGSS